jgi:hypothetical protein
MDYNLNIEQKTSNKAALQKMLKFIKDEKCNLIIAFTAMVRVSRTTFDNMKFRFVRHEPWRLYVQIYHSQKSHHGPDRSINI